MCVQPSLSHFKLSGWRGHWRPARDFLVENGKAVFHRPLISYLEPAPCDLNRILVFSYFFNTVFVGFRLLNRCINWQLLEGTAPLIFSRQGNSLSGQFTITVECHFDLIYWSAKGRRLGIQPKLGHFHFSGRRNHWRPGWGLRVDNLETLTRIICSILLDFRPIPCEGCFFHCIVNSTTV